MKTPLTITRADDKHNVHDGNDEEFTVMINPEQVRHDQKIRYDETKVQGQRRQQHKFSAIDSDTVSFDLVLDGTGVVRQKEQAEDVAVQLRKLRKIVYAISKGSEPNHVRLLWGSFLFFGRLRTFNTTYTLFKPSGEPLRAKLALSFVGSVLHDESELDANRDHLNIVGRIQVGDSDTLPLVCFEHYGDASYYPEVARHNGLSQVDPPEPGTWLELPCLMDED